MRVEGLEPSIPFGQLVLSQSRMPIPPHSQRVNSDSLYDRHTLEHLQLR